ncbi:ribosome-inactivating protein cucurmosin-like [Momordica charantia]|uniref:rRNA N-glycosylase n=1 Tax=Momordica charantia TaxID=3673 RepID=A0A6J1DBC7_MOMCH|nr:ribosome-inactivating protein cucurmosin-like [Momordica charantia]
MNKFSAFLSIILAIFVLDVPSIKGRDPLNFNLLGVSSKSYKNFIEKQLRPALPSNEQVYSIPVLLPTIADKDRFLLINLANYDSETITVAVDVLNVPRHVDLDYSSNYKDLEGAAHASKEEIPLGFPALDAAITNMISYNNYRAVAKAFIVIIQTFAEAARFQSIMAEIAGIAADGSAKPSASMLSLETQWSALSKNIQYAKTNDGQFQTPVEIIDGKNNKVKITNVTSKVVTSNVKLLLNNRDKAMVMPSNCGYTMGRKWMVDDGCENHGWLIM